MCIRDRYQPELEFWFEARGVDVRLLDQWVQHHAIRARQWERLAQQCQQPVLQRIEMCIRDRFEPRYIFRAGRLD